MFFLIKVFIPSYIKMCPFKSLHINDPDAGFIIIPSILNSSLAEAHWQA